ncbi:MAG: class I SAM-dependent methyltransferase [bacterium]
MSAARNWISPRLAAELISSGTNAFRMASGHDFWIERFGDTALISLRPGPDAGELADSIESTGWTPRRVYVRHLVRNPGEKDTPVLLRGEPDVPAIETVSENGLFYELDFSASYSPGLFPDQRLNRQFLKQKNPRRVLNTFAYTCAFSLAAASCGAETLNVDISKSSLERGRRNFELNRIPTDGHRFIPEDVPTFLRRLFKRGEKFDAIILDPPTFGRSGTGKTFRFERDFPQLLECASQLASAGAAILLSTNFTAWDTSALITCARGILPSKTAYHSTPPPPDFFGMSPSSTVWALL